jgi:HD-like signal output (HDOD) protein
MTSVIENVALTETEILDSDLDAVTGSRSVIEILLSSLQNAMSGTSSVLQDRQHLAQQFAQGARIQG